MTDQFEPVGLNRIEDRTVRENLKLLFDMVKSLIGEVRELGAPPSLDDIKPALESEGSHELDLEGLIGVLAEPQPSPPPVVTGWDGIDESGPGLFAFALEFGNPINYKLKEDTRGVSVRSLGDYLICGIVSLRNPPSSSVTYEFQINGVVICDFIALTPPGESDTEGCSSFAIIRHLEPGDTITIEAVDGERVKALLSLYRLPGS